MTELDRIRAEYARRSREIPPDFYSRERPANRYQAERREAGLWSALDAEGRTSLSDASMLEVGCGDGDWLDLFRAWGVPEDRLAGIELDPGRAEAARRRLPTADVRVGNAAEMPWPSESFDLVLQSTVFTSILDPSLKNAIAEEMIRVVKPSGAVLWYDFFRNNPFNPHVKGIGRREIRTLFPGFRVALRRVTLAPPLARALVPVSVTAARAAEWLVPLRTHYLAVMTRERQRVERESDQR